MITRHFSTPQYRKLFKVSFLHEFYKNGKSNDFEVRPTAETRRFLSNHKLLFRELDGGMVILYAANREVDFIEEGFCFSFVLINKTSTFTHFSALPLDINTGKAYHFKNWHKEAGERLTTEEFAGDVDRVLLAPQAFQYSFREPQTNITIKITNEFGEEVLQEEIGKNPTELVAIDLRDEPLGKYFMSIDDNAALTFYTCDNETEKAFGMVNIKIGSELGENQNIWDEAAKEITPRDYVIHFAERKTYWRYFFIKRKEKADFRDYKIVHTHHEPNFLPPEKITLSNGKPAVRIESKYPISLKERLEGMYQLKVKKNGKGLNTSLNLPTPPVRMVKPDDKNTAKVYSDMYVYL
jgi:hypothetical protein